MKHSLPTVSGNPTGSPEPWGGKNKEYTFPFKSSYVYIATKPLPGTAVPGMLPVSAATSPKGVDDGANDCLKRINRRRRRECPGNSMAALDPGHKGERTAVCCPTVS